MKALHRLALLAYPRAFRKEFGAELQRLFEERTAGGGAWLKLFLLYDVVISGLAERWRARAPGGRIMTWDSLVVDVRLFLRRVRAAPLFAVLTVASLALGIGANTAMFAVVHSVLLQPLPYDDPEALVAIWSDNTKAGEPNNPVSPANVEAFRAAPSLERVEGMYAFLTPVQVRIGAEPEPVLSSQVTPGMFSLLGREPLVGRRFDDPGAPDGVMLSYRFWEGRFGRDPEITGKTLTMTGGGEALAIPIIGVMPPDFTFPYGSMLGASAFSQSMTVDVWFAISRTRDRRLVDAAGQPNRSIHYFSVIGRLRPGATVDHARADLETIAARRASDFPDTNTGWGVTVRPLHEQTVGSLRPALVILLAGVGVVLLITCMNVANILLARASGRGRDLAVRSALGASGGRLVQQMLTESVLLSLAGGIAGLGVMSFVLQGVLAVAPANLPRIGEIEPSWPVFSFALGLSCITGLVVGLVPAVSAVRAQAQDALRDGARTTSSRSSRRTRAVLIVAEVALAMVLAVGAGLLLRSFVSVLSVHPGFNPDRLLTMQLAVPPRYMSQPEGALPFYDELEGRLRALPGVIAIGGTTRLPLGSTSTTTYLEVEGRPLPRPELPEVEMRNAVYDFFAAMEIPVLRGRAFTRDDRAGAPRAVVVNETLAQRVFPGEDPVGRHVRFASSSNPAWMTIVGVVGDIRHGSLEERPKPEIYVTYRQGAPLGPFLVVRTGSNPAELSASIRKIVRDLGADPPRDVRAMEDVRRGSVQSRRFLLLLVGAFGVLSVALAALGVFGVVTLIAVERTTEVGIRLALGATPMQVRKMVLAQAARLAGTGILVGLAAAMVLAPLMRSQLFGVTALDPVTYASVALVLVVVALAGAYIPARRAMRVDPASALRV